MTKKNKKKIDKKDKKLDVGLTRFQSLSIKLLGKKTQKFVKPQLKQYLIQARIKMLPEEYVAFVIFSAIITGVSIGIAESVIIYILYIINITLPFFLIPLFIFIPILISYMVYALKMDAPRSKAKIIAKDIDKKLPFAMNFISAMASADVPLTSIFSQLSQEKIYGEVAKEASYITRDVEIFNMDIISALKASVERVSSLMFQDFLQGVITTLSSGGRLKPYFVLKTRQYMDEYKIKTKKYNDFVGMLAESFVTVVVVMPLLLIVMLSVMSLMGGGGGGGASMFILYFIAFMMVPMSQFMFAFIIKTSSPEVG